MASCKNFIIITFSILLSLILLNCGTTTMKKIHPPIAKKIAKSDTLHGDVRIDNYFWLRHRDDEAVLEYLRAENDYTEAMMSDTEEIQEKLFGEMKARIKETDLSVPVKMGDYYYYSRTEEGKQYSIICRKKGDLAAEEEILLDQNALAEGLEYFDLRSYQISTNHQVMAYAVDTTGAEVYTIYFKDLESGEMLPDVIPTVDGDFTWANDNQTIFYTIFDETNRPYKVMKHTLGNDVADDEEILHEEDGAYFVWVSKTRSHDYLIIGLSSKTTSEMWFLDANTPDEDFRVFQPRQKGMEYYISNHGDTFYILTNDNAKNFKLMKTPVDDTSKENWKSVIPHRETVKLEDFDLFKDHLVLTEREKGLTNVRIITLDTDADYRIEFPEPVYSCWLTGNREFETNKLRFYYTSFITPASIYDYNMDTKERELLKQYEVLGEYNSDDYITQRIFAEAPDSTLIPISIVYKRGVNYGSNPMFLTGYGAYGSSSDVYFSSSRLSLLNRGFIYAIAHIRGGEEMGRYWYEEGKLLNKKNTFTDFIACAEYLIKANYTSPEKLVISGGSAGGLLVGAVTNMRPDLFEVVIASVPFVDVLNTMLDPTIPLTVGEYEEWGNPNEEEYYFYMKSYSPYDNIAAKDYPNMLVTAGLNDPRVPYWEAAKYVAKLRDTKTDDNLLLLKTNMGTGHMGASGRYNWLREIAFEYAFIFKILGIEE